MGVHALAALTLKEPELSLNSEEGKMLADQLINISEHYGLVASKGVMLWVNFAGCAAMIYAPRFGRIKAKQANAAPKINTRAAVSPEARQPPAAQIDPNLVAPDGSFIMPQGEPLKFEQ